MGRVDCNWTKSGGRLFYSQWPGVLLVSKLAQILHATQNDDGVRVAISTAPEPQGSGRVDPHSLIRIQQQQQQQLALLGGVVTETTGRDSSRYRYHDNRRQLALDCE